MLQYRELGTGDTIIILHGLYGSSDNWLSIARKLPSFRIIIPDLRNHGHSPHYPSHTYEDMVEDIHALVKFLKLDKLTLLGHSMGGKVAMLYALKYEQTVRRLIVADIAPINYSCLPSHAGILAQHKNILHALSSIHLDKYANRTDVDKALSAFIPETNLRAFLLKNLAKRNEKLVWKINLPVLLQALPDIIDGFSEPSNTSLIPTLFIKGEQSPYIPTGSHTSIKRFFPKATCYTIANADHWLHVQAPEKFIEITTQFLDDKECE